MGALYSLSISILGDSNTGVDKIILINRFTRLKTKIRPSRQGEDLKSSHLYANEQFRGKSVSKNNLL